MVRVSEHFRLHREQPALDFIDVNFTTDIPVFVDPRALRLLKTDWGRECVSLVQDFFRAVMDAIKNGDDDTAKRLLRRLREPNETHLGYSAAKSRGRALGRSSADDVWRALSTSEAAQSGLLEDLEDTVLLVEGIGTDIISDITTDIIRQPLIHYTQTACNWYRIPLTADVDSGPMWDPIPKAIVRRRLDYDAGEYYRHFILEHLQGVELSANSELVRVLKKGRRRVTKKALKAKYGEGKLVNLRETRKEPSLLTRYRQAKNAVSPPLDHESLAAAEGTSPPNWAALLNDVIALPTGPANAANYERAIESLLSALFYPALVQPEPQTRIHDGRKRIDITYTNAATAGFFSWLSQHYSAPYVYVECKNYEGDPTNPELDQLSGRFSPQRGQAGLLVCRSIKDKDLFAARCRDTAQDSRGYIVYLDDQDLRTLVDGRGGAPAGFLHFDLLKARFDALVR